MSGILEKKLARDFGYDHAVMLGRARSGLVALLEVFQDKTAAPTPVLLPENICPVLVTAIRAGGGCAVPVPVSPLTGLPDDTAFVAAMEQIETPGIVSPTHLYGFEGVYPQTIKLARQKGWFILENDANAIRMQSDSAPFGDALLVSFGYAKPIEVGTGGAFLTNDPVLAQALRDRVSTYDLLDSAAQMQEEECMLKRRAIRATLDTGSAELARICDMETSLSRFRFDETSRDQLMDKLNHFPREKERRIEQRDLWDRALAPLDDILLPVPLNQPVPWRVIRNCPDYRDHFTHALWHHNLDAGINYRSLWREVPKNYLSGSPKLPDHWGENVINLWLTPDYDRNKIYHATQYLMETYDVL
ncbi:MAG: DegT/DnrJ/EryC1/StrS family aminotransferase [Emcibacter sp.]|nr:DegT/DnrJ/EryC1/StrS family aminotransferase [Emcibacter sp.]